MNDRHIIPALFAAMADSPCFGDILGKSKGELPTNGAWRAGGKCKGRSTTNADNRAFAKRVAKRRAKKGYR